MQFVIWFLDFKGEFSIFFQQQNEKLLSVVADWRANTFLNIGKLNFISKPNFIVLKK